MINVMMMRLSMMIMVMWIRHDDNGDSDEA